MWLFDLIPLILQYFATMVANELMWLVIILVAIQYRRIVNMREELFGIPGAGVTQMTAVSLLYGIIGGLVGSLALFAVGISVNQIGIAYLWPLAILLMLINIRFLCFSYAGGIIALSYLLFGFPQVEVPQLAALVGLLHLIEAILIYANGYHDAVPVYTRTANGKVVGAFMMQKFWPIPIVVLVVMSLQNSDIAGASIKMPDWWPLIKSGLASINENMLYVPLAVAAALGYGDIAITSLPKEKSRISSFYLFVYSTLLLAIAVGASNFSSLAWLGAIFMPLGHELVIKWGRDKEVDGKPLFAKEAMGLRIFEVVPESPAEKAGLQRGDLMLTVNGLNVNSKQDFTTALAEMPWMVEVDYIPYGSKGIKRQYVRKSIPEAFGVLFPPEPWEKANVETASPMLFKKIFQKLLRR